MQIIGCDVAKATFDIKLPGQKNRSFSNRACGFAALLKWINQALDDEVCVVLEATGVYHLPLAAFLVEADINVLVANPGRARAFAKSQNQLNKSDPLDAFSLQRYGQSLELSEQHLFIKDPKEISTLKALLSRITQLEKDLQRERNRLEKCDFIAHSKPLAQSIKRQIRHLTREINKIEHAIESHIQSDPILIKHQQLLCSIKGIGVRTARWLLPLLYNQRFKTARQLAAYLGLTPRHEQSGTQIKPGQLSGLGNRTLRSRFYFPAISAATHDPALAHFYQSLLRRGRTKKQALIAVMRKLIHIAFGVIKHQTPYDPNYAG
jgi:transposase